MPFNINDHFAPQALEAAIVLMPTTVETPVLDTHFPTSRGVKAGLVKVEMLLGAARLLPNIDIHGPATVEDKSDRQNLYFEAPYIAEAVHLSAGELLDIAAMGQAAPLSAKQEINTILTQIKANIDTTREFYAHHSMAGRILDSDGVTVIIDWQPPAEHTEVLSGDDLWTAANSDPVTKLRAAKKAIRHAVAPAKVSKFTAWVSPEVMDALVANPRIMDLMMWLRGPEIAEKGRIANLVDIELREDDDGYKDKAGTWNPFLTPGRIRVVGHVANGTKELFAPCPVLGPNGESVEGGVGKLGKKYTMDHWYEKNPDGLYVRGQCRPVPANYYPSSVYDITAVEVS